MKVDKKNVRTWVWHSRQSTTPTASVSILAIAETLIASLIGLWLISYGHYWIAFSSVVLNLLVHFRSSQSISLGANLFDAGWQSIVDGQGLFDGTGVKIALLLAGIFAIFSGYEIADTFDMLLGSTFGVSAYYVKLIIVLNVAVAFILVLVFVLLLFQKSERVRGTDAHSNEKLGFFSSLLLTIIAPSLLVVVSVPVVVIRAVSTLRYLGPGIGNYVTNWRNLVAKTDVLSAPEMMPGLRSNHPLSLQEIARHYSKAEGTNETYLEALPFLIYVPSVFYRLILKSSFWLYIPLLWVATPPRRLQRNSDGELVWDETIARTPLDHLAMLTSVGSVIALAYRLWDHKTYERAAKWTAENELPVYWQMYLSGIDPAQVTFWYWLPGISATLALTVWVWAAQISAIKKLSGNGPSQRSLWFLAKLNSLKNVLSLVTFLAGLAALGVYFYHNCYLSFVPDWLQSNGCLKPTDVGPLTD